MVQPLWKTVWTFFKILKIELPYDLTISLGGINPKEIKHDLEKNICTAKLTAVSVIPAKYVCSEVFVHGNNLSVDK